MTRTAAAAVMVIAILVAGGAALALLTSSKPVNSTVTAPTFPGYNAIATESNSTIGIDLSLALNSTSIKQGQDIHDVVQVLNTFPHVNNISVGNHFPVGPHELKCLPGDYTPIVVQMYLGNYVRANISSATPLAYTLSCPPVADNSLTSEYYYLFEPNSPNATLYGRTYSGNFANTGTISLRETNQISIYQFSSSFQNAGFPLGVYTLMVEDWWGQMVILHFTIVA